MIYYIILYYFDIAWSLFIFPLLPPFQAWAIRERIGYSDNIMTDQYLDNEYKDVSDLK